MYAFQPYTFRVRIGSPIIPCAWIYHKDFRYTKPSENSNVARREGFKSSQESEETSQSKVLPLASETPSSANASENILNPNEPFSFPKKEKLPDIAMVQEGPELADTELEIIRGIRNVGAATIVYFEFQGDNIHFDTSIIKSLPLWKQQNSHILPFIITPEKTGSLRIKIKITTDDGYYQDHIEIPFIAIPSEITKKDLNFLALLSKRGDEMALEQLLIHPGIKQKIYSIVYQMLGEQQAEDAYQEVCIRIAQSIHRWQERSKITNWIGKITIKYCYEVRDKLEQEKKMYQELENIERLHVRLF